MVELIVKNLFKILVKGMGYHLLGLLVIASAVYYFNYISKKSKLEDMKELKIYLPFVFSKNIDPRAVHTVGDQLISEHIFAYHYSASEKESVLPLFSNVHIDHERKYVNIDILKDVFDSRGYKLTPAQICNSIKSSLSGTQHTKYSSLVESVECDEKNVKIKMSAIPINLEYWLRSTDFAILNIENLPVSNSKLSSTTGPFFLTNLEPGYVELKLNKFFPEEFRSNNIETVIFQSYSPGAVKSLGDKSDLDLAYLYGYTVSRKFLDSLRAKGFKYQIFPNEWLVYIGFHENVSLEERRLIASLVDTLKESMKDSIEMGSLSYSTTPSDRAFGLLKNDYEKLAESSGIRKLNRELTISTLDEWVEIPLFKHVLSQLQERFSIKLKIFTRKEMSEIYSSDQADLYLSPMGISAADPLGNYSFLRSFNGLFQNILTDEILAEYYKESDFIKFSERIKELEYKIIKERVLVPIGHFPGVVLESSRLSRDDSKSWDWGIQAWTYKVD